MPHHCPQHGLSSMRRVIVHKKGCPVRPCAADCIPSYGAYCGLCGFGTAYQERGVRASGTAQQKRIAEAGIEVWRLRTRQGLSQRKLAEKAGCSSSTVSLLELGLSSFSDAQIASVLAALGGKKPEAAARPKALPKPVPKAAPAPKAPLEQFAAAVFKARCVRALDVSSMARLTGIPLATLKGLEHGVRPQDREIREICDFLEIPLPRLQGKRP